MQIAEHERPRTAHSLGVALHHLQRGADIGREINLIDHQEIVITSYSIHYTKLYESHYKSDQSPAIIREMDKCIMCRRCETACTEVQTVGVLSAINRGFESVVATAFEMDLDHSSCTFCGQCVAVCPTGALTERDSTREVMDAIVNPTKTVIVNTAPAVRAALGEEFGMPAGTLVTVV